MRMHAYINRAPESHRVQPSIPLYPWQADRVLGRRTLLADITSSIVDCDICTMCQDTFDSCGWYTRRCGHRFHLYCIVHHMCHRSSCPMCQVEIDLALYRMWGIDDLFLGRGETIDPVTRLPLGVDVESQRQRVAESLIEEGYTEDFIIDALEEIEPVIHPSLQPETPLQIVQRQAHWERLILEARDKDLQRPRVAAQLGAVRGFLQIKL